jgi:hypothetical protein
MSGISTQTAVTMVDARINPGTITLPYTTAIPYRVLTIKDAYGAAINSTITLITQGSDKFEDGTTTKLLTNPYETITLYAGQPGYWYTVGGSRLAAAAIGRLSTGVVLNPLNLGTVSSQTNIGFFGLQGAYNQTAIAEMSTGFGTQELALFRGSSISDRIRLQTTGEIRFEPGVTSRVYPNIGSNATPAMVITATSNVGLGLNSAQVGAGAGFIGAGNLDAAGQGRFFSLSTIQFVASSIKGDGSQLQNVAGLSTVAAFASNAATNAGGSGVSSLFGVVSSGLSTIAAFTSNTSNYFKTQSTDISTPLASTALSYSQYFNTLSAGISSLTSSNIWSRTGYISSLVVDQLQLGSNSAFFDMGDVLTVSLSSGQINTNTFYANSLYLGSNSTITALQFYGLQGAYNNTVIDEAATSAGSQELLLFKGSSATDQIRLQTTGNIVFEPGAPARLWPSTPQLATATLFLASTGQVGINTNNPQATLDVAGSGRFTSLSTLQLAVSSIRGDGSQLQNVAGLSTLAAFTSNVQTNSGSGTSSLFGLVSTGLSSLGTFGSNLLGITSTGLSTVALFTSNTSNYYQVLLRTDVSTAASTVALFTSNTSNYYQTLLRTDVSSGLSTVALFTSNTSNYYQTLLRTDVSSAASTVALFTSNTSNYYQALLRTDVSSAASTVALFTSNTSNYYQTLLRTDVSSGLSTVALFTSNTSNYYQALLRTDVSSGLSTVALFTSNTSNYYQTLLRTDVSSGLSTVALFTSNTSNWSSNLLQNWSTPLSTATLYMSNTSNYYSTLLRVDISTGLSTVSLFGSNTSNFFLPALSNNYSTNLQSTVIGLGSAGYISTGQFQSSMVGIASNISSMIDPTELASSIVGLGAVGFVSSIGLTYIMNSTVIGINTYVSSMIDPTELTSTVTGLGATGFISSIGLDAKLGSTLQGLGTAGYASTSFVQTISTFAANSSNFSKNLTLYDASTPLSTISTGYSTFFRTALLAASTVSTVYVAAQQANISSLQVNSLVVGTGTGFVNFGLLQTTQLSSVVTQAGYLYAQNEYLGTNSTVNALQFYGLSGQYTNTAIAEQTTGPGTQELLLFKGSSVSDQVRVQTTGGIVFEAGITNQGLFPSTAQVAIPTMVITNSSNIGIGMTSNNVGLGAGFIGTGNLDVAGAIRAARLSTLQFVASSIKGDGSQLQNVAGLSTVAAFASNAATNAGGSGTSSLFGLISSGLSSLGAFGSNTLGITSTGLSSVALFTSNTSNYYQSLLRTDVSSAASTVALFTSNTSNYYQPLLQTNVSSGLSTVALFTSNTSNYYQPLLRTDVSSGLSSIALFTSNTSNYLKGQSVDLSTPLASTGQAYSQYFTSLSASFSSVTASNVFANTGFISSLVVNSLSLGYNSAFLDLGDVILNSASTIQLNAGSVYSMSNYFGTNSTITSLRFFGLQGAYNNTVIQEAGTSTGSQELLLFKGSSAADQIRLQTTGNLVFEAGAPPRLWPSTGQLSTATLFLTSTGQVGINTNNPQATLDVAGSGRFVSLSTLLFTASSIKGDGSQLQNVAGLSTVAVFGSNTSNYYQPLLRTDVSSAASTLALFTSNTSNFYQPLLQTNVSSGLSTVALFTSNTSNFYQPLLQTNVSSGLSTVALFTSNTSNYYQPLLRTDVSSGLSSIALFTSNTSNYLKGQSVDLSTPLASTGQAYSQYFTSLSASFSSITASNVFARTGYISSLVVDSLAIGYKLGILNMGDIITTSQSTVQVNTGILYSQSNYFGTNSTITSLRFFGLQGAYNNTVIQEAGTSTGSQELLLFKGSSAADQIRLQTTGNLVFEAGAPPRLWPSTGQLSTATLFLASTGRVGINTNNPQATLDVAGSGRFVSLSTLQLTVSSVQGDGSLLQNVAGISTVAAFTSNSSNWSSNVMQNWSTAVSTATLYTSNTSNFFSSLLRVDVSSGLSTVALFTSNTSNFLTPLLANNYSTNLQSTVQGLGTYGYISTAQFQSSMVGIASNISSMIDPVELTSSIVGLGAVGFVSSIGLTFILNSTVTGLTSNISSMIDPIELTSTVTGLGAAGFVSSIGLDAKLASTVQGLGTAGYASTSFVQTISTFAANSSNFSKNLTLYDASTPLSTVSTGYSTFFRTASAAMSSLYLTNFYSQQGSVSSLQVNALTIGTGTGFVNLGPLQTVNISTLTANIGNNYSQNTFIGTNSTLNALQFFGLTSNFTNTAIAEQTIGPGNQELLLFKGSSVSDQVRIQTTGAIVFEAGITNAGLFPSTAQVATPTMVITNASNVGIGITAANVGAGAGFGTGNLDVANTIRAARLSTLQLTASSIKGDGSQLQNVAGLSTVALFTSNTSNTFYSVISSGLSTVGLFTSNTSNYFQTLLGSTVILSAAIVNASTTTLNTLKLSTFTMMDQTGGSTNTLITSTSLLLFNNLIVSGSYSWFGQLVTF